jgi:hypothetical protein
MSRDSWLKRPGCYASNIPLAVDCSRRYRDDGGSQRSALQGHHPDLVKAQNFIPTIRELERPPSLIAASPPEE